jgi:hypothetical protein
LIWTIAGLFSEPCLYPVHPKSASSVLVLNCGIGTTCFLFEFARSAYLNGPTDANAGWSDAKIGSLGALAARTGLPLKVFAHFAIGLVDFCGRYHFGTAISK